jgi:hypothetical protein
LNSADDQVFDQYKMRQTRDRRPTDDYVVDFFVNAFPDIFMIPNNSSADGAEPGEADKEKIPVA